MKRQPWRNANISISSRSQPSATQISCGAISRLIGPTANAVYDQAVSQNIDAVYLHLAAYYSAFLKVDDAAIHQQAAWAAGKPNAEDLLLSAQSDTEAYFGHLSTARQFRNAPWNQPSTRKPKKRRLCG